MQSDYFPIERVTKAESIIFHLEPSNGHWVLWGFARNIALDRIILYKDLQHTNPIVISMLLLQHDLQPGNIP